MRKKKRPANHKILAGFFVKPEFIMEFIQHILPYFAVIGHILGGRRVKAGGKQKSQPNKFVWLA